MHMLAIHFELQAGYNKANSLAHIADEVIEQIEMCILISHNSKPYLRQVSDVSGAHVWIGWILKWALISKNTKHLRSCIRRISNDVMGHKCRGTTLTMTMMDAQMGLS